jgi:hypothetical protein
MGTNEQEKKEGKMDMGWEDGFSSGHIERKMPF